MQKENETLKITAVQMEPKLGQVEKNREKIKHFVKKAGEEGSDLIVLPELANSGYNFPNQELVKKTAEEIPEGETTRMLEKLAREYNTAIVAGINERKGQNYFNSAVIVDPHGYKDRYRKIHLFDREKLFFEEGEALKVTPVKSSVGKIKVGTMICFDWFFPESTRILAARGAEIITHPVNLVLPYAQDAMPIRALENKVFTVTANRIGEERKLSFTGRSQINDPNGNTQAEASKDGEEIISARIKVHNAKEKKITERNRLFDDVIPNKAFLSDLKEVYHNCLDQEQEK